MGRWASADLGEDQVELDELPIGAGPDLGPVTGCFLVSPVARWKGAPGRREASAEEDHSAGANRILVETLVASLLVSTVNQKPQQ